MRVSKSLTAKLVLASSCLAFASAAQAADGTITFNGELVAPSCTISVAGGGASSTVTLPTLSVAQLSTAGATAGRTPFAIALTGCTGIDGDTVSTWFEPGATVDAANNRLISSGTSNASLRILNAGGTPVALGAGFGAQNASTSTIAAGAGTLNYYVEYLAHGAAATAGTVQSSVIYSILYQ